MRPQGLAIRPKATSPVVRLAVNNLMKWSNITARQIVKAILMEAINKISKVVGPRFVTNYGANLNGANLVGVRNFTAAQLASAGAWSMETRWPDGYRPPTPSRVRGD